MNILTQLQNEYLFSLFFLFRSFFFQSCPSSVNLKHWPSICYKRKILPKVTVQLKKTAKYESMSIVFVYSTFPTAFNVFYNYNNVF